MATPDGLTPREIALFDQVFAPPEPSVSVSELLAFCNKVIEAGRDGDVDGGDVQEWAVAAGLLIPEQRSEPCGLEEVCRCAEYYGPEDAPWTCFRLCPALLSQKGASA